MRVKTSATYLRLVLGLTELKLYDYRMPNMGYGNGISQNNLLLTCINEEK